MMGSMGWRSALFAAGTVCLAVTPADAQVHELARADELRLAMSAGPTTVAQRADVYVLGRAGFERVIEGDNGWSCLVVRSADDERQIAPHCLNPHATATVLPAMKLEGRLQREGLGNARIQEEMQRRWEAGTLPTPEGPAFAYMLSSGQRIGPNAGRFQPHFMLYVPGATNESVGGSPQRQQFGFVGPYEGHPLATVVIIMDEFVDPAEIVLPGS